MLAASVPPSQPPPHGADGTPLVRRPCSGRSCRTPSLLLPADARIGIGIFIKYQILPTKKKIFAKTKLNSCWFFFPRLTPLQCNATNGLDFPKRSAGRKRGKAAGVKGRPSLRAVRRGFTSVQIVCRVACQGRAREIPDERERERELIEPSAEEAQPAANTSE